MARINGAKLAEIRTTKGVTQKELAKVIGVHPSAVAFYEANKNGTSEANIIKIADFLGVNADDIRMSDAEIGNKMIRGKRFKNAKRYVTPIEAEAIFESYREKRGYNKERELGEVDALLPLTVKMAGISILSVNPILLHYPDWQREVDTYHAKEIYRDDNYLEAGFDAIKIFVENGKLYVADGGHRALGALLCGRKAILATISDKEEAMDAFLMQSYNVRRPKQTHLWKAAIKRDIPQYMELREICVKNRIQIVSDSMEIENPKGVISPSGRLLNACTSNPTQFNKTLELIDFLGWNGSKKNPYNYKFILTLNKLYARYSECKREFEDAMYELYYGAEKFEKTVATESSMSNLYDRVREAVDSYMAK